MYTAQEVFFFFPLQEVDVQQDQLKQGVLLSGYMYNCSDPNPKPRNPNPSDGAAQDDDWIWKVLIGPQWLKGFHRWGQKQSSVYMVQQLLFMHLLSLPTTNG